MPVSTAASASWRLRRVVMIGYFRIASATNNRVPLDSSAIVISKDFLKLHPSTKPWQFRYASADDQGGFQVRVWPKAVRQPSCRLTQCDTCRGEAFAARNPGSPPQSPANASPLRSRRAIAFPPASGVVHPRSDAGARAKHPLCGRWVSQQWFCECFAPTLHRTALWLPVAFWPHPPSEWLRQERFGATPGGAAGPGRHTLQ